jgi:hypothetical protein
MMTCLTSPRDPLRADVGVDSPLVAMHRRHPCICRSAWRSYWQHELMTLLIQNEARRGAERPQHPRYQDMNTSYSEFLVTHPPLFSGGRDPLETDDWLRTIESKFSVLNCTEYQKTLYVAQQLRGLAGAWWASYTAALPADHHVPWASSVPLSVATTCQRALCAASLRSFWICAREAALSTSILRN